MFRSQFSYYNQTDTLTSDQTAAFCCTKAKQTLTSDDKVLLAQISHMARSTKPRKKYRPKRNLQNPIDYVLKGVKPASQDARPS